MPNKVMTPESGFHLPRPTLFWCSVIHQRGCLSFFLPHHIGFFAVIDSLSHEPVNTYSSVSVVQKNSPWWIPVKLLTLFLFWLPALLADFKLRLRQDDAGEWSCWEKSYNMSLFRFLLTKLPPVFCRPVVCRWKTWHKFRSSPTNVNAPWDSERCW